MPRDNPAMGGVITRPADAAGPVVGHIQTDTFCQGCGYNLHTQAVMRDDRLGILVCRCPECGRFAAAGQSTPAANPWLNRLALLLLVLWVLFVLGLLALCTTFLGMTAYGHVMNNVRWVSVQGPIAPMQSGYRYTIEVPDAGDKNAVGRQLTEQLVMGAVAAALGGLTGGLFSVVLWHLKWPWRALAWLAPVIGCTVAALAWVSDPAALFVWRWGLRWIATYLILEGVTVGAGLLLGRPVVRGVLRLLLPPRPLQHLAFLWTVDGKRMVTSSGGEKRIRE